MIVVLADVVDSRRISDRKQFQKLIVEILSWVNKRYEEDIEGKFSLTKGIDEFSGVLKSGKILADVCAGIQMRLGDVGVRFSAARGEVDIYESGQDASRFDGPAFHRAVSKFEQMERHGRRFVFSCSLESSREGDILFVVSNLMTFCLKRIQSWPEMTARVSQLAWEDQDLEQMEIAERLGISQQAVSAALRRADFRLLRDSIRSVRYLMKEYD